MLSAQEIEDTLRFGYERRGFELKGPGSRTDSHLMAKVIRSALSMGNLRSGGHIVIGINDKDPAKLRPGLTNDQVASWLASDDVARKMGEYADPPLAFEVEACSLSTGARVVIMQIHEFADMPHLCAKQYDPVLRKGALYVRSRGVPETSEVASSVEMRELLDLATEKALRAYVETAHRAGLALSIGVADMAEDRDALRFDQQREGAWSE